MDSLFQNCLTLPPVFVVTTYIHQDKYHIIVDGNHRLIKTVLLAKSIQIYEINKESDADEILEFELAQQIPKFPQRHFLNGEINLNEMINEAKVEAERMGFVSVKKMVKIINRQLSPDTIGNEQKSIKSPVKKPFCRDCLPQTTKIALKNQIVIRIRILNQSIPPDWSFIDRVFVWLVPNMFNDTMLYYADYSKNLSEIFQKHHIDHLDKELSKELVKRIKSGWKKFDSIFDFISKYFKKEEQNKLLNELNIKTVSDFISNDPSEILNQKNVSLDIKKSVSAQQLNMIEYLNNRKIVKKLIEIKNGAIGPLKLMDLIEIADPETINFIKDSDISSIDQFIRISESFVIERPTGGAHIWHEIYFLQELYKYSQLFSQQQLNLYDRDKRDLLGIKEFGQARNENKSNIQNMKENSYEDLLSNNKIIIQNLSYFPLFSDRELQLRPEDLHASYKANTPIEKLSLSPFAYHIFCDMYIENIGQVLLTQSSLLKKQKGCGMKTINAIRDKIKEFYDHLIEQGL